MLGFIDVLAEKVDKDKAASADKLLQKVLQQRKF
jgi:hypothetical protein